MRSQTSKKKKRKEKMTGFDHYIIFGNGKEGTKPEDYEKFGKAIEKLGLKLKYWGHPFGVSEEYVIILKGPIAGYEKLIGDSETFSLFPITNNRTITVYTE